MNWLDASVHAMTSVATGGFSTRDASVGAVAQASARPKRIYPLEEVEAIRAQAYAEGERAAMARVEAQQAQAQPWQ